MTCKNNKHYKHYNLMFISSPLDHDIMFGNKDHRDERTMIFIDLDNLQNTVSFRNPAIRLDYAMFKEYLEDTFSPRAVYVFDSRECENTDDPRSRFHNALSYMGYRVKLWRCSVDKAGERYQKCVDTGMVCEILKHLYKDHADNFVIISGDRDFLPVMDIIHDEGKVSTLICDKEYSSRELMRNADRILDICNDLPDMATLYVPEVQPEQTDLGMFTPVMQEVE